jgi:3-oxoacyl-[acyl-carrier-protein] synthase II
VSVNKFKNGGSNRAVITDMAAITALGDNLETLWQKLMAGKTAIRSVSRFPVESYHAKIAACIDDLKPSGGRSRLHPLLNRLFSEMAPVPPDSSLITATLKAGIDNLEALCRGQQADFQDVLLSSLSDIVCQKLGLIDSGISVSATCASSTIAVAHGAGLINSGRSEAVLICCGDLITEYAFAGFSALKALSPVPCRPFDRNRKGLSLGEGAAALLLMSAARARRENREQLGSVLGWGITNDATHITAPDKSGRGLIHAIDQALKTANLNAAEIIAVNAHGTGTIYNDLMELTAFRQVFGERKVPVCSAKGAIGHTLGAAGGIEAILGLKTLATQIVPPTVGFSQPEIGAEERVSPEPQPVSGDYLLTTNSGFGGVNAALILGK